MDAENLERIGILEQATAACWGSLAVIDRCGIDLIQPYFRFWTVFFVCFRAQPVSLSSTQIPERTSIYSADVFKRVGIFCCQDASHRSLFVAHVARVASTPTPTPTPTPLTSCQDPRQGLPSRSSPYLAGSRPCWPWQSCPERNGCLRGLYFARWRVLAWG